MGLLPERHVCLQSLDVDDRKPDLVRFTYAGGGWMYSGQAHQHWQTFSIKCNPLEIVCRLDEVIGCIAPSLLEIASTLQQLCSQV